MVTDIRGCFSTYVDKIHMETIINFLKKIQQQ